MQVLIIAAMNKKTMKPLTRHRVSSEGSFFFPRINFKLVHSYNVKHLTCIIFCRSGLQNIYIKGPFMEMFNIYNIYIGLQKFIYKIDLKVI